MKKDQLQAVIEQIEDFCKNKNIHIFYGIVEENIGTEVVWQENGKNSLEQYLEVIKNAGAKILTLTIEKNELDKELIFEYASTLEEEELEEFTAHSEVIINRLGQTRMIVLTFFQDHISYQISKCADWNIDYLHIQSALDEYLEDYSLGDEEEEDALSEGAIEQEARKLITNSKYLKAKDRYERSSIVTSLLQKENTYNYPEIHRISKKAEAIFMDEILPQIEEELSKKVKQLKGQGRKKVEVRAKLGISETTLNKYWY